MRTLRRLALAACGLACLPIAAHAQPATTSCSATFDLPGVASSYAHGEFKGETVVRLFVEMGPAKSALTTKGAGVSGAYKAKTTDLGYWPYMSVYQPTKDWLVPGGTKFDYSGFRLQWPEFSAGGKEVKAMKLTVTQGDRSMTVDVSSKAAGGFHDQVLAIDFEAMLAGRFPIARVDDHAAWRRVADTNQPILVTLTDTSNGKVIARGQAAKLEGETPQTLLSGAVNALRAAYKNGECN